MLLFFAQNSAQLDTCLATAITQSSINVCAGDESARADAELSGLYKELFALVAGRAEIALKIKAEQKAWFSWRDAYLDAMYPAKDKQFEYGSIYPFQANLARAKLTRQQTGPIRDLIKQFRVPAQ